MKKKTHKNKNKNKKIQYSKKYKNKNKKIRRNNTKKYKKYGGKVSSNEILTKIISLGFEFETGNMIPVALYDDNMTTPPKQKYGIDSVKSHDIGTIRVENEPVDVMIVSSTDTPLGTRPTYSLLSHLEDLMNPESGNHEFQEFIKEHIMPYGNITGDYMFYNHTEYIFTFRSKFLTRSINDENIILKYFKNVVDYLKNNFTLKEEIINTEVNSKLKIFNNGSLMYLIPMKSTDDFTPTTIKWVPQMTINIKVIDVISVLEYLTIGLDKDSINNIKYSKDFASQIYGRKSDSISDILKNVCFMLAYLYLHSADGTTGTLEENFNKNNFDFLFRCSLSRIIISLYEKYDNRDVNKSLSELKSLLEIYKGKIEQKRISNKKSMTNFEDFYAINACTSFINFITLITTNDGIKEIIKEIIQKIKDSSVFDEKEELYQDLYTALKIYNQRALTSQEIDPLYLSTNSFFTEIFSKASNYYPYDIENESFLIEFRSFSQNILIESDTVDSEDVYRDLNIWSSAIDAIENSGTQGASKKIRR